MQNGTTNKFSPGGWYPSLEKRNEAIQTGNPMVKTEGEVFENQTVNVSYTNSNWIGLWHENAAKLLIGSTNGRSVIGPNGEIRLTF